MIDHVAGEGLVAVSGLHTEPAGVFRMETHAVRKTAALAIECGLEVVLHPEDQPSIMKNKPGVTFTRMVVSKRKA